VLYKLFGVDGPTDDFGEFGSQTAGTPVKTKDVSLIQSLTAWTQGWKQAIIAANRAPFLEDMNSLHYVTSYMLAYLMQEGIPEWNSNTEYHQNSIVKKSGTSELYSSKINTNTGNPLPSQADDANWSYIGPTAGLTGEIKALGGPAVPSGYLLCDGAAVSRTTYSNLFSAIGVTWGAGNGSTTFNLPDLRGKTLFGKAASGTFGTLGASGGVETHTHVQSAHSHTTVSHTHIIGSHTHTIPSHSHTIYGDAPGVTFSGLDGKHVHAINKLIMITNHSGGTNPPGLYMMGTGMSAQDYVTPGTVYLYPRLAALTMDAVSAFTIVGAQDANYVDTPIRYVDGGGNPVQGQHGHTANVVNHTHGGNTGSVSQTTDASTPSITAAAPNTDSQTPSIGSASNVPPFAVVNYIIKT
jgi:microcystin-dependent protein